MALKVTVPLNVRVSGSFLGSIGDMCGISQQPIGSSRRAGDYVCFRTDPNYQAERVIVFGASIGLPQVQGVTDYTHVAIKAPAHKTVVFINRKGFHSLNVQLICDYRKQILQVLARFLGSCHNAYNLRQFQVPELFWLPTCLQGWIFGDKSYPLRTWLLTPVRNLRTDAEERYSICHGSTQVSIQQAIGLLKMSFRCKNQSSGALQYALASVSHIVVVSCALHNMSLQRGEVLNNEECEEHAASSDDEDVDEEAGQASPDEGPMHNRKDTMR
ncbi:putative nuclease HARBI1 [Heterodontus francisci]|uniref:putative nuclease HARBI1 n=1 Tax=Heterodontus francisci TaxID=7792 RepID=UPI00355BB933